MSNAGETKNINFKLAPPRATRKNMGFMNIKVTKEDGIFVLTLHGRFDTVGAVPVQQELDSHFNEHPKFIVMDMSGVDFISSAGIRVLLITAKETAARQGILALVGLNQYCRDLIETTHIAGFLSQFDTLAEAQAFCETKVHPQ